MLYQKGMHAIQADLQEAISKLMYHARTAVVEYSVHGALPHLSSPPKSSPVE